MREPTSGKQIEREGDRSEGARSMLSPLFGASLALSYALFAFLAYLRYPTVYSPAHNNTLSQLGNVNLNPHGAIFYIVGCAVSGTLTIAFFISLRSLRLSGTLAQSRLLLLVQGLGVVGGFGLVMNAVFPENHLPPHHFWSGVVFNSLGAAMLLSPFTFRRPNRSNIILTGFAGLSSGAVVLMFVFAGTHWVEWLPVALFLISPGLLGVHTRGMAVPVPITSAN